MGKIQDPWVQMGLTSFLQWIVIPPILILKEKLRSWLPVDMNAAIAQSAGTAMGILKRDRGRVYEGIVLDHDLEKRPASESDLSLCGTDVVDAIIRYVSKDVPILIHSVNESQAPVMHTMLEKIGFKVERIPMNILTGLDHPRLSGLSFSS